MSGWQQMLDADVLTLGMSADDARRARPAGNTVTYLRVHDVSASDLQNGGLVPEAATELRFYATPASRDEAIALLQRLRELAGDRRVAAFSMFELASAAWFEGASTVAALARAGLDDVAELEVDRVADLAAAIRTLRDGDLDPQRITVRYPVSDRKVQIISAVERAAAAVGPVSRFAPLPRVAPADKPTTGYDDLRMVSLARLALPAMSIEIDWTLYGPKLAQVALTFGADHLDAVPATDDPSLGRRRATVENVERNIRAAGFAAQEHKAQRADLGSRSPAASSGAQGRTTDA